MLDRPGQATIECPSQDQLERYLAGHLSEPEISGINRHTGTCGQCRSWLNEAREDEAVLGSLRRVFEPGKAGSSAEYSATALSPDIPALSPRCPERIGPYTVVRMIGQGGMGVVLEARQAFPDRHIAIKLLHPSRSFDPASQTLFEREIRALARLHHPGIAAIHDAGHTSDGQPYLVMELVAGVDLGECIHTRSPALSLDEKLSLFVAICEAISYAHQRGVIHRDIKPANILVQEGTPLRPRVLDFGLARITDVDSDLSILTEPGRIRGTLAYMSPEQARGHAADIDIRSDVYSLGVVLYELLTGKTPYVVRKANLPESVRLICEEPPTPPSRHDKRLRGDLETIILKALEKEPAQRYQSVAALAEDLKRFSDNQPILARPPSAVYQLGKLVRRHKSASALIAAMLMLTLGAAIWLNVLYRRSEGRRIEAELARQEAGTKAKTAAEIQGFLEDMLTSASPDVTRGMDSTLLKSILAVAAARVDEELADEPEAAAGIHRAIGNTYLALGVHDFAERHLNKALDIRRAHHGERHVRTAEAMTDLAILHRERMNYAECERLNFAALQMHRDLLGDLDPAIAETLNNIAALRLVQGRHAEAEEFLVRSLAIQKSLFGEDDADYAVGLTNLGMAQFNAGKCAEAMATARKALEIRTKMTGALDGKCTIALNNLASMILHCGEGKAIAEEMMRDVLETRLRLLGEEHAEVAGAMLNLAMVLESQGKGPEAALFRDRADAISAKLAKKP